MADPEERRMLRPAFDASVGLGGGCLVEEGIIASGVRPKAEEKDRVDRDTT